jgi:hypothetical protein
MIDITKILKRAWNILWSYRALWIIGMILALTTASMLPRDNNSGWRESARDQHPGETFPLPTIQELQDAWEQMQQEVDWIPWRMHISTQEWNTVVWIGIGILFSLLVLGVVSAVARYVAETATIRMVDEYERTGNKVSLRQGLRYGWSRTAWRLFLINLLIGLPVFLLVLGGLVIGVVIFFLVIADNTLLSTAGIVALIGLVFLLIFLGVILGVVLNLLRDFFWRACALEGVGVGEAIRQGWSMVRRNWKSVGLMWLVMIAVRIGWAIGLVLAFILSLPVLVLTILAGLIVGGLPGMLVGLVSSLFLGGPLPWIVGVLFGLPFFLVVAFSPLLLFRGLGLVYSSTAWTLTYRELKAMHSLSAQDLPVGELPQAIL